MKKNIAALQKISNPKPSFSIFFSLLIIASLLLSPAAYGQNGEKWIILAEKACIPTHDYAVTVTNEVYKTGIPGQPGAGEKVLQKKDMRQMIYTKEKGLRAQPSENASSFSVDIASMLQKMKGKADWRIENEAENVEGAACAIVSSSGDGWMVRLWIRQEDGAVLRYDQYLNGIFVGSSMLTYGERIMGTLLPIRTTTEFNLTGQVINQHYTDYAFTGGEGQ